MSNFVDMHTHSHFSDGTKAPIEMLKIAEEKGISILAIADHDLIEGSRELLSFQNTTDIKLISAVELTAVSDGVCYHILGYGVDLYDERFSKFCKENRAVLEGINNRLILKMAEDYSHISFEDYNEFTHPKEKGGWKALHYLISTKIAENEFDSMPYYAKYNENYIDAGFPTIETICKEINLAGGKGVLAHPGKVIKYENLEEFKEKLLTVLKKGIQGIECYYPSHTKELTKLCLDIAEENNLIVTCGSDSHGDFVIENTPMGILPVTVDMVNLKGLI